jgi:hypothetical protein
VVGVIAVLKKLTTTALNLSLRAGNLLNVCWKSFEYSILFRSNKKTHNLCEQLAKNTDELVIHKLATFQARLLQSLDLLLDNNLESSGTNKERRG